MAWAAARACRVFSTAEAAPKEAVGGDQAVDARQHWSANGFEQAGEWGSD